MWGADWRWFLKLRRQLHILTSEIDGSLASISERRDRDQARREGCEPLAELARKAEAACGRCGGLSCDIEMAPPVKKPSFPASTPTGSGDQTRSLTIIIGSEGELACFAIGKPVYTCGIAYLTSFGGRG